MHNDAINILYEDDDLVAIDKPSGLVVHFDGRTEEPSVCDWFTARYPEAHDVGEPLVLQDGTVIPRPGVVHRLDRETSGVLVLAKTAEAHAHLKQQFHDRLVQKEYRALVWGHVKDDEGTIDRPIGRSRKDPRLRSAQRGASGTLREAVTEYRVISRGEIEGERITHVAAFPKTGRTHQLRTHFKAINHSVVCDALYAPKRACPAHVGRLALHAYTLELRTPAGRFLVVEAPIPPALMGAVD